MLTELGSLEYGLTLVVLGLGAVVLILAMVFMVVSLVRLMARAEPAAATAPVPAPLKDLTPEPAKAAVAVEVQEPAVIPKAKGDLVKDDEIPDELLPVLIAAAATAIGKPVRVKDVVLVRTEKPNVWGTQGRIVIQRSHDTATHQW